MRKLIIFIILLCQPAYAGSLIVWGNCYSGGCGIDDPNEPPDYGLPLPDDNDFIDIALGGSQGLALKKNGEIIGWGLFSSCGVLENIPEGNFVAIEAGDGHAVALDSEGYITAWGDNYAGRCDVSTEPDWIKIAASRRTTAAIKNDGTIGIWGSFPYEIDESGELIHYLPADNYIDIKVGEKLVLALKSDGTLSVWGDNTYSQLDDLPEGTFKAIGCGVHHCLAVRTNGTLAAWGRNSEGDCNVPAGNDYIAVDGGRLHSVSIREDGSLSAWGWNYSGQCDVPDVCQITKISVNGDTNIALTSESNLLLTIKVEPNDINTVLPTVGNKYCYIGENVLVNAIRCPLCPYVWEFDYWSGDISEPNESAQYVKMFSDKTITAYYKRLERFCGDECHPILQGDMNKDCYINFDDFAIYAASWLACTHPDCD